MVWEQSGGRQLDGIGEQHEKRQRHCGDAAGGAEMRKFVRQTIPVVVAIGLLTPTLAWADPVTVTSGFVTAQHSGGTFTLRGDGFSFTGAPTVPGYESGFWECSHCRASDRLNLSLSSTASGSFDSGLEGEFRHVHYDAMYLTGVLLFTAGDMTSGILGGQTSISMPFTFRGELLNYATYESRATPGSVPLFIATFTGAGIATAHFRGPFPDPGGPLFFADRITYEFGPAAPTPTPEPSSLILLGTGAGLLARRRARRDPAR